MKSVKSVFVLGAVLTIASWAPFAAAQSARREDPRLHFEKCFKASIEICQFAISGLVRESESLRQTTSLKTAHGQEIFAVKEASVRKVQGRSLLFVTGSWLSTTRSAKSLRDLRASSGGREAQVGLRARKSVQSSPYQGRSYETSDQDTVSEAMNHLSSDRVPNAPILVQEQEPKIQYLELEF
jgi:hypothetical protein